MITAREISRGLGATALTVSLLAGTALAGALPALAEGPADADVDGSLYAGDPAQETAMARAEDRRITDITAMMDSSRWAFPPGAGPLTLPTGESSSVVLLAREEPYTLDELTELVPEAVERQDDGSYLISAHLVVDRGATLSIRSEDGLVVHLDSTDQDFATIVSIGGALDLAGGAEEPVQISGWDSSRGTADAETSDGRAYVRAIGGSVTAQDIDFRDLGFWSGPTGGLALTGTEAPRIVTESDEVISDPGEATAVGTDPEAVAPLTDPDEKGHDGVVTASLTRVSAHRDAIGLFATNVGKLEVAEADFSDNLLDGMVLHRFVTGADLQDVTAHDNGADGIRTGRGTTDVTIDGANVSGNGDDGIRLDGSALADGPSSTGVATGGFGGFAVSRSVIAGNGRYGIQVTGGSRMALRENDVSGHRSGIVVNGTASDIEISGNDVRSSLEHGISLRDGVLGTRILGNSINGADTALYARGSSGEFEDNTISRATNHGITVIDQPERTRIARNTIAGSGPAAIDSSRSGTSVILAANSAAEWDVTKPLPVMLQRIFQPLTVLWLVIGVLLVASASTASRSRPGRAPKTHPYASHTPLTELSAGVVVPGPHGGEPAAQAAPSRPHGRRRWPYPRMNPRTSSTEHTSTSGAPHP